MLKLKILITRFRKVKVLYIYFLINIFIYLFLAVWVFVAVCGLSLVAASEGFSLQWLLLLQNMGSRHIDSSSCGIQAQ